jgi:hypothetical protein
MSSDAERINALEKEVSELKDKFERAAGTLVSLDANYKRVSDTLNHLIDYLKTHNVLSPGD